MIQSVHSFLGMPFQKNTCIKGAITTSVVVVIIGLIAAQLTGKIDMIQFAKTPVGKITFGVTGGVITMVALPSLCIYCKNPGGKNQTLQVNQDPVHQNTGESQLSKSEQSNDGFVEAVPPLPPQCPEGTLSSQTLVREMGGNSQAQIVVQPTAPPAIIEGSPITKEQVTQELQGVDQLWRVKGINPFPKNYTEAQKTVVKLYYINYRYNLLKSVIVAPTPQFFDEAFVTFYTNKFVKKFLQDNFQKIWGLNPPQWCAKELKNLDKNLGVTATVEQIIDVYVKHNRLILLRPLVSQDLVLGCGWGRCGSDHFLKWTNFHALQDTVDIQLKMNPSIIYSWGREYHISGQTPKAANLQMLYFANRYSTIYDEGSVIMMAFSERSQEYFRVSAIALRKGTERGSIIFCGASEYSPEGYDKVAVEGADHGHYNRSKDFAYRLREEK